MNSITLTKYISLGLDSAVSFYRNGMSSSEYTKNQSIDKNGQKYHVWLQWKTML
jgi:hypothetical protein